MRYHLDEPITAAGMTFRAVSQISGHEFDLAGLITGTRQKEMVALLVNTPHGKVALGPNGQTLNRDEMADLRKSLPEIGDEFG